MKFQVENMSCGHCVRTITRAIQAIDPQAAVTVDLAAGTVRLQGQVDAARAIAAMAEADYPAREIADQGDDATAVPGTDCCGSCHA